MKSPRAYHAVNAFVSGLQQHAADIQSNLKSIEPEIRPLTILSYFSDNLDNDMFPLLMVENTYKERTWEALDTGSGPTCNIRIGCTIWGLIAGHRDDVMNNLADELESSVADILNSRHRNFTSEGWTFYFNETMPMPSCTYGVTKFAGNVVKGFTAPIVVDAICSVPQAL